MSTTTTPAPTPTPARPDPAALARAEVLHPRTTADAIATLFVVPEALAEAYAEVSTSEAAERIRARGLMLTPTTDARHLAWRLASAELRHPHELLDPAERQILGDRAEELERELLASGEAHRSTLHSVRLDIASERVAAEVRRAEVERLDRSDNTDPVTGAYDRRVHGVVEWRSIVPGRGERFLDREWHGLRSSSLTHHLAATLFAIRALERDEQLAAAVEAQVQRMLDDAGL